MKIILAFLYVNCYTVLWNRELINYFILSVELSLKLAPTYSYATLMKQQKIIK
jgi:hypothetical protein